MEMIRECGSVMFARRAVRSRVCCSFGFGPGNFLPVAACLAARSAMRPS